MGRFDSLKDDNEKNNESNPFKKGGRRREKNEKGRDFSKLTGTMALPGINKSEKKSGKYVAPGLETRTEVETQHQIIKWLLKQKINSEKKKEIFLN